MRRSPLLFLLVTLLPALGEIQSDDCEILVQSSLHLSDSRIEGSVRMAGPGNVDLHSESAITGSLTIPGTPRLELREGATTGTTGTDGGSPEPNKHRVFLGPGSSIGGYVTSADPPELPEVLVPEPTVGTRSVTLRKSDDDPGDIASIARLNLHAAFGPLALPPGRYDRIDLAASSTLQLGSSESPFPQLYEIGSLSASSGSKIEVLGPVEVRLGHALSINGIAGNTDHPEWLLLTISEGGLVLNSRSSFHGTVVAPRGNVTLNDGSLLKGSLVAARLKLHNGSTIVCHRPDQNLPPLALDSAVETNRDTPVEITLNATDPESEPLSFRLLESPAHGTIDGVTGDQLPGPTFRYFPDPGYVGNDGFQFVASDGIHESEPCTVTITVREINRPPVALDLHLEINQGTTGSPILLSASDPDRDDVLTFSVLSQPEHGLLAGELPSLTYSHTGERTSSPYRDSFTYQVADSSGLLSAVATVNITLNPVNRPPLAEPLVLSGAEDEELEIDLPANDPDGDELLFSLLLPGVNAPGEPLDGILCRPDGTALNTTENLAVLPDAPELRFIPDPDFNGSLGFAFTVTDGSGETASASILIDVAAVNDAPVVADARITLDEDTPTSVVLSAADVDGDALEFLIQSPPAHGTLTGTAPDLLYTPDPDFHGPDSFSIVASDGALPSPAATVEIEVNPVNDAPGADDLSIGTREDTPIDFVLTGHDPDGDLLSFEVVAGPSSGTLSGTAPELTYTPASDFNGSDAFTFRANDGDLFSQVATVRIEISAENDPPVAQSATVTLVEDDSAAFVLTATDPENDPLAFRVIETPEHGTLNGDPPNLLYTPDPDFAGTDAIHFAANDGTLDSLPASVTLVVTPVADAPVAFDSELALAEDQLAALTLAGTDADDDALTYAIIEAPEHGLISGTPPDLTYIPEKDFAGADLLRFLVSDGTQESAPATVSITVRPVPDPPLAFARSYRFPEDTTQVVTLGGIDPDGDSLVFTITSDPSSGSLAPGPDGATLVYTPAPDFNGTVTFSYVANDGSFDSQPAVVTLEVTPVNDAPTADTIAVTLQEDNTAAFTLSGFDPETDPLTFAIVAPPRHGTVTGGYPNLLYSPDRDYSGTDTLEFVANDGQLDSAPSLVTFTITPLNDAPAVSDLSVDLDEDGAIAIDLPATDPEGDPIAYTILTAPEHGTLSGTPPSVLYTPEPDFHGTDRFTWQAADAEDESPLATVTLLVSPTNDPPSAIPASLTLAEDTPTSVTLAGTDIDGDSLAYSVTLPPAHGTLSGIPPQLTYTPDEDFNGNDSLSFVVHDGESESEPAPVQITVTPVNDAPVGAPLAVITAEDTPLALTLPGNDVDSPELFYEIVAPPAHGLLSGSGASRSYTPSANFFGTDAFTYRIYDGADYSPTYTVSITVESDEQSENRPPVITSTPRTQVYSAPDPLGLRFSENGDWDAPHVLIPNAPEAELVARWGDIDNFGYGWPSDFDPFSGASTPAHHFPFYPESDDPAGTDRIMIGSGGNPPRAGDGYTATTKRPDNLPQPISLRYSPPEGPLISAKLQVFADDFQSSLWGSRFQVTVDGERFPVLEDLTNQLLQTGPIGRLVSVEVPPDLLHHFEDGSVDLLFDDPTTGAGDGYAVDFVKLLLNPNNRTRHFEYTLRAFDPDGDPLTYQVVQAPAGFKWDSQLNILRWTPPAGFSGSEVVEFEVRDNQGGVTRQLFRLQVSPEDQPPVVTVYADRSPLRVGQAATFSVAAVDDFDVTDLSLLINGQPVPLDASNRAQLTFDEVGEVDAVAIATDSAGQTRSATLRLLVATTTTAIGDLAGDETPPAHQETEDGTPATTPPIATPIQQPRPGSVISGTLVMECIADNPSGDSFDWNLYLVPSGEITAGNPLEPKPDPAHRAASGTLDAAATRLLASADTRLLADGAHWLIVETISPTSGISRRGIEIEIKNSADPIGTPTTTAGSVQPPSPTIEQPASGSVVTDGSLDVIASVTEGGAALASWSLALAPAGESAVEAIPTGEAPFVEVASGTSPATSAVLVSLDSTTLSPGPWLLRLSVFDADGQGAYSVRSFTWSPAADNDFTLDAGSDQSASEFESIPLVATLSDPLPEGALVHWSAVSYPATSPPAIDDSASLSTRATLGNAGTYTFEIRVTFPSGERAADRVNVVVSAATAPEVRLAWPLPGSTFAVGSTLRFAGATNLPATDIQSATFLLDGSPAGSASPDPSLNDSWRLDVPAPAGGSHRAQFSLTLFSGETLASSPATFTTVDSSLPSPEVDLTFPAPGETITAPTDVIGRVDLAGTGTGSWSLSIAPVEGGESKVIASDIAGAALGSLATLDPTLLSNGAYRLTLVATNASGTSRSASVDVLIEGSMKVGHFSLAFEDLSVPLSGLPLTVTRTYDSRRTRIGDFGPSWEVGLRSIRIRKAGRLGEGWEQSQYRAGFFPSYAIHPTSRKRVIIAFPDGRTETFEPVFRALSPVSEALPNVQQVAEISEGTLEFRPLSGSVGTLEIDGIPDVIWNGPIPGRGTVIDTSFLPANPTRFRYTEPEGTSYVVDENLGLVSLSEPNGNTLTISPSGVFHSNGESVLFTRDATGRITELTDPAGEVIRYAYDENGRLSTVTNRVGDLTTFLYENPSFPHYLTTVIDPRGIPAIRTEFDADGRLVSQTDAAGNTTEFEHDLSDRRELVRDPLGNLTIHEYDERGNVVRTTDALGGVTSHTYDSRDNETSVTTPLGFTSTRSYDDNNSLVSETDPLARTTTFAYDSGRRPFTITDALGQVTHLSYSLHGNLLSVADPLGTATSFSQDSSGNLESITDPLGTTTLSTHDSRGNELTRVVTGAEGATLLAESYTYDANGARLSRTVHADEGDFTTSYELDSEGRITLTTLPDGSSVGVVYNSIGKVAKTIDALGRETILTYDERGNLIRSDYPDGTFTTSAYDALGRQTATTDAAGVTVYTLYDALGREVATILPDETMPETVLSEVADIATSPELQDNPRATTTYDADGRIIAVTDPLGQTTTYEYDAAGRRTAAIDALGNRFQSSYDAIGRRVASTDALGQVTSFEYDAAGRPTRTSFPDGTFTSVTYDALGRRTSATDPEGNVTRYEYDGLGRLTAVVDAEGGRTEYEHDSRGLQTVQRDALGRETHYEYDTLGRRIRRTLPLGQSERFTYDSGSRLVAHTDFNGYTTALEYDPLNDRLLSTRADPAHPSLALSHAPARFDYAYDALGRRTSASVRNASGVVLHADSWEYDLRSRVVTHASTTGTLHYAWDDADNLSGVRSKTSGGYDLSYDYDPANRLSDVYRGQEGLDPAAQHIAAYSYTANGALAGVGYANQVTHTYAYDSLNRLTSLTIDRQPLGSGGSVTSLQSYSYTLDKAGQRTRIDEQWSAGLQPASSASSRTIDYTYDRLHRLRSEAVTQSPIANFQSPSGTLSYTYDAVGNRLARSVTGDVSSLVTDQSHTFDANDRLSHHQYDSNGNTTASPSADYPNAAEASPSGTAAQDVYSFRNRLIRRSYANGVTVDLTYNADGDRVGKWVDRNGANESSHRYLVDQQNLTGYAQIAEELDDAGNLLRVYHIGHDVLAFDSYSSITQSPNLPISGAQRLWFLYDGLGSVRALADDAGELVETYTYEAWGQLIALHRLDPDTGLLEPSADLSAPTSPLLFTGEQWDRDLGMYFLRARYLNPGTGRFHTQDSYEGRNGEPLSLHKYAYGHGNPVGNLDPTGHATLTETATTVSGLTALAGVTTTLVNLALVEAGAPPWLTVRVEGFGRMLFGVSAMASAVPLAAASPITASVLFSWGFDEMMAGFVQLVTGQHQHSQLAEMLKAIGVPHPDFVAGVVPAVVMLPKLLVSGYQLLSKASAVRPTRAFYFGSEARQAAIEAGDEVIQLSDEALAALDQGNKELARLESREFARTASGKVNVRLSPGTSIDFMGPSIFFNDELPILLSNPKVIINWVDIFGL